MSIDPVRIASALRVLADAIENTPAPVGHGVPPAETTPPAEAPRRGRGRPAKGESAPAAATVSAPAPSAAPAEADPFADAPAAAAAPTATLDEVRAALTELKAAASQEIALKVLKDVGGVSNLSDLQKTPEKYGAVVSAARAAMPSAEADPFATGAAVVAEAVPTKEEVRAAIVAAQKRTSANAVQQVVMRHGGKAPGANGVEGPSLQALPVSAYATVIKEVGALPTTK